MYRTLTSAQFRSHLSHCLTHVSITGGRLLLTRNGADVAAMVSVTDLDRLEEVDNHTEEMMEARHLRMMAQWRRLKEGGG